VDNDEVARAAAKSTMVQIRLEGEYAPASAGRSMPMAGGNVVLGTGPLGIAVARHLAEQGEPVRAVNRSGRAEVPAGVDLVAADVTDRDQARPVFAGARVVYHCASPPYHRWAQLHPPLMEAVIAGATTAGARLVFGDNLYAYGPVDGTITEDLPYAATGPNGRARAQIADAVMAAHQSGRVAAVIGRGSDFFGRRAHLSTVGDRVFARAVAGKPAQVLGNPDVPRSVTYLEDFARALVNLGECDDAVGEVWHVPCPSPVTTRRFVELVFQEAGRPARVSVAPEWGIAIASLFNPTLRAVREQLYQHRRPWVVDSGKFERAFGWKATPLPEAIRATVAWFTGQAGRGSTQT
jgi:nucleoside-diphosphate-sugar epimerase